MGDVLVVGGTGMLSGVVDDLVERGHRVLLPSRHPVPSTPHRVSFLADWTDPPALVARVSDHLDGPLELAVVWCHRPHRTEVVDLVTPLLAPSAPVVEVLGSTALLDLWDQRPPHGSTFVMLGHRQLDDGTSRWLTHAEISAGVVGALDRGPGATVVVGSLD